MKVLTDYITALLDLVEAEHREIRGRTFRMGVGIVIMAAAGCMAVAALGLFLAALFIFITWHLNVVAAAVITGAAALVIGFIIAEIGLWISR